MPIEPKLNKGMTGISGILLTPLDTRGRVAASRLRLTSWGTEFTPRLLGDMKRERAISHHKFSAYQ
jgi:hypothetical protein